MIDHYFHDSFKKKEDVNELLKSLKTLKKELHFNSNKTYLNMPFLSTMQREFVFESGFKLQEMIKHIHQYYERYFGINCKEYIFDYSVISSEEGSKKYLVTIVHKEEYLSRLNLMKLSNISLKGLEPEINALARYYFYEENKKTSEYMLVLKRNQNFRVSIFDRKKVYYEDNIVSENIREQIQRMMNSFNLQYSGQLLSDASLISEQTLLSKFEHFQLDDSVLNNDKAYLFVAIGLALRGFDYEG